MNEEALKKIAKQVDTTLLSRLTAEDQQRFKDHGLYCCLTGKWRTEWASHCDKLIKLLVEESQDEAVVANGIKLKNRFKEGNDYAMTHGIWKNSNAAYNLMKNDVKIHIRKLSRKEEAIWGARSVFDAVADDFISQIRVLGAFTGDFPEVVK